MALVDNKKVASAFFASMRRNDTNTMSDLMTDDAIWWIAPGTRFSGRLTKIAYLRHIRWLHSLAAGPHQMAFRDITAEDNRVAIFAKGSLPLKDGRAYQSYYSFLLNIREGRIAIGREFLDVIHANEIFGASWTILDAANNKTKESE